MNREHDEAHRLLAELDELAKTKYVSSYGLAAVCAALEDVDEAFERLELAHAQRAFRRHYLKVDPRFIPLRKDPLFADWVERFGL